MQKSDICLGFTQARSITKKHAKTFYFASLFLSREKAAAAYSIYSICRISDDSVDRWQNQKLLLKKIKDRINKAYSDEGLNHKILSAFRHTVKKYDIPKKYFDELLSGMEMDLSRAEYADFGQLKQYCYKVAGVVGLMMLKILGTNSKKAEQFAVDLGIAMQLTNILRDIKEDLGLHRIYLPKDEMKDFGIDRDTIEQKKINGNFRRFLQFQIKRARDHYQQAEQGICLIKSTRCRFVAFLMSRTYAAILTRIEKNDYDVFSKRAYTSNSAKIMIALSTLLRFQYLRFKNQP